MAATLQLLRETNLVMELRRGTFDVVVDGKGVGSIDSHQTIEVPIEPGHHTLQVKAGRYTSGRLPFDAADGEIVGFAAVAPGPGPSTSRPSSSRTWRSRSSTSNQRSEFAASCASPPSSVWRQSAHALPPLPLPLRRGRRAASPSTQHQPPLLPEFCAAPYAGRSASLRAGSPAVLVDGAPARDVTGHP